MKKFLHFTIAVVLMLVCAVGVSAQPFGVVPQFASADPINLVAGDSICFQLVAQDSLGNVLTNWSSFGNSVEIEVLYSVATTDTSLQSWSRHADGYTWRRLTVGGVFALQISPDVYVIHAASFVNGVATACYASSMAEQNVRLEVKPTVHWATQISPPITFVPAALDNYLVEVTYDGQWQSRNVYAHRPFEVVVSPRDRFLNKISQDIPARIEALIPAEIEAVAEMPPDPFNPNLVIAHTQNFFLRPTAERLTDPPQRIRVSHPTDPLIDGVSDPIFAIPHAPFPATLTSPADQATLTLQFAQDSLDFDWQKALQADPYTDVQLSRFSGQWYSDSAHYRIHFTDLNGTMDVSFDADGAGQLTHFVISEQDFAFVINLLAGSPVTNYDLQWYVETTDGTYSTNSTPVGPGIPGRRLSVTNQMFSGRGVALDARAIDSTVIRVGDDIRFDLKAVDKGNIIEDWNATGTDVELFVRGATAESDTSMRSWSSDPDAYSWAVLEVNGREILPSDENTYTIPRSEFLNGIASIAYRTSKFEPNVSFEISPTVEGLNQSSPPLQWEADTTENFLIELTWHYEKPARAFLQRRFEIVVAPRDRYLNVTNEQVGTRFSARFPGEFDTNNPGGSDLFAGVFYIKGITNYWLLPSALRQGPSLLQHISVQSITDPAVFGQCDPFEVVPHAPTEFTLAAPENHHVMNLTRHSSMQTFAWQRPNPPDPYTDIMVSRFDPRKYSDDVRYTWVMLDSASLTFTHRIESDNGGVNPTLTITESRLYDMMLDISSKAGAPVHNFLWYVEATDGLFITNSNPIPGHYFSINADLISSVERSPLPSSVRLAQNYPNPFNPTTTIRFSTTKRGDVSLKVFDLLGREVAMVHNGTLDAGEHSMHFDASKLRSGVYVYRLDAEGKSLSRRMVVMK